jgi:hypothetical protein
MVERTEGYAVRSLPLSPQEEADTLDWYYRTYLKFPGATLGVVPRAVIWQAPQEGDGRRRTADTTALGRLVNDQDHNAGIALLYSHDGQLLYAGPFEPNQYVLLKRLIERAL